MWQKFISSLVYARSLKNFEVFWFVILLSWRKSLEEEIENNNKGMWRVNTGISTLYYPHWPQLFFKVEK